MDESKVTPSRPAGVQVSTEERYKVGPFPGDAEGTRIIGDFLKNGLQRVRKLIHGLH